MVSLVVIFYMLLATNYYYYQLETDKIIVRNRLRPYYKELPYATLLYINLYGDISKSIISSDNCLEFIYQYNDSSKNYEYFSNYNVNDWKLLIGKLKGLNIKIEDPNNSFFRNSETKLEHLT